MSVSKEVEALLRSWVKSRRIVGYSRKIQKKIRGGQVTDIDCIRIYVKKKRPLHELAPHEVIPALIEGMATDVVEIGEVKALSLPQKTERIRPLVAGTSVGHWDISAGTISYFFDYRGDIVLVSNAHVLTNDPSLPPEQITEKRITQPGPYDLQNQNKDDYVVAQYRWHQQIYPLGGSSTCPVAKGIAGTYNFFARLLKRKTRLIPVLEVANHIDFAVADMTVGFQRYMHFGDRIEPLPSNASWVGLLFGGSETNTVICKGQYIESLGYKPLGLNLANVSEGLVIYKSGRTTCFTQGTVTDASASVTVSYGSFEALFEDIIVSDIKSQGGDSGAITFTL
jgi:hypothetical protein